MPKANTDRIKVLLISSFPEDHASLERILWGERWQLDHLSTCREAVEYVRQSDAEVVICERDLPDGDWKLILHEIDSLSLRPSLVVTSRLADEELWAKVLNLGGYDVLA